MIFGDVKITNKIVYKNLDKMFEESPREKLEKGSKWVIFSDLHMGDGGSSDDFNTNADLFVNALHHYYFKKEFKLFLNGDVEELQRYPISKIVNYWGHVFELFAQFAKEDRLIKTIGNHDLELSSMSELPYDLSVHEGFRLGFGEDDIFLYHGHQASKKYQQHNELVGFTLKYFANPLGIKNYSVSHSSVKQFKIEKKLYHYSSNRNIISVIGHTHRPLFESLDKMDRLKYKIDQLCREYTEQTGNKSAIKNSILAYKNELKKYQKDNESLKVLDLIYHDIFHVPCLFNSGTVIGKRGMTCLEIDDYHIRLVHWFDKKISKKYLKQTGYAPEQLGKTDFYRMVINEEPLDYIFTRIKFLS